MTASAKLLGELRAEILHNSADSLLVAALRFGILKEQVIAVAVEGALDKPLEGFADTEQIKLLFHCSGSGLAKL